MKIAKVQFSPRVKTEEEITDAYAVEILKQNKKEGRAFAFLPFKAREWAKENPQELLVYSRKMGNDKYEWVRRGQCDYPLFEDTIYALPDDYELQSTVKNGEWIEFDIDDKGFFTIKKEDENLKTQDYECWANEKISFHWADWAYFLNRCLDLDLKYRAFGGWKFNNSDSWSMVPVVEYESGFYNQDGRYSRKNIGPAIPVKIRFWRKNAKNLTETEKDKIENFLINNSRYKIPFSDLGSNIRNWLQSWPNIRKCLKWNGSMWISCNDTDFFEPIDPKSIFCLLDDYEKTEEKNNEF